MLLGSVTLPLPFVWDSCLTFSIVSGAEGLTLGVGNDVTTSGTGYRKDPEREGLKQEDIYLNGTETLLVSEVQRHRGL